MSEMNTQHAELMSGNLDWIRRIPPDQAKQLEARVQIINAPIMRFGYVDFAPESMTGDSPIEDARVRQAIIHATNRGAIVEAFAGGASKVLNTASNPAQFGCDQDETSYEYDPEKAPDLVAEAGYGDGFEMERVFAAMPRDRRGGGVRSGAGRQHAGPQRAAICGGHRPVAVQGDACLLLQLGQLWHWRRGLCSVKLLWRRRGRSGAGS